MGNKDEDTFTCSKYSFYDSDMCPLMTKYFFEMKYGNGIRYYSELSSTQLTNNTKGG